VQKLSNRTYYGVTLMSLRQCEFGLHYATSTADLIDSFYVPALKASIHYSRGVGFFSSRWFSLAAEGLAGLADNGGTARIVTSPILSAADWEAFRTGTRAAKDAVLLAALREAIQSLASELKSDTLVALAWMIADGLLEIRLALPEIELDGDFHDKFGFFVDAHGDVIAFHGSPNDSQRAFRNYESISVFCSWVGGREGERVILERERFERIWAGREPNLQTISLPDAIRFDLVEFRQAAERPYRPPHRSSTEGSQRDKWRHQAEAERIFLDRKRGVLEMATGTGKTRTALRILDSLSNLGEIALAVVVAFGTDLLDQWYRELNALGSWIIYRQYEGNRELNRFLLDPEGAVLITSRQMFPRFLAHCPPHLHRKTLLVFDEVHGIGAESMQSALTGRLDHFVYRLGLSATPEREYDQDGNDFIASNIGPVIYRFGVDRAIAQGILCEFDYAPLEYFASDEDKGEVRRLIARHHARLAAGESDPPEALYRDLADVYKRSLNKLPVFQNYLNNHSDLLDRCLIFVANTEYGRLVQEIILRITGNYHTYYGDDERSNLVRFARGELDCLVTCHRISEGIDVQSTNHVVLFASARARLETIQRIGRCLRVDPNNPSKRALVVDFIRIPDHADADPSGDEDRRAWLAELSQTRLEEPHDD